MSQSFLKNRYPSLKAAGGGTKVNCKQDTSYIWTLVKAVEVFGKLTNGQYLNLKLLGPRWSIISQVKCARVFGKIGIHL